MRAAVLCDVETMEVREIPDPTPAKGEVLVRTAAVGLCGTDFHIHSGEANYNFGPGNMPIPLTDEPQVLGHEITGVIEDPNGVEGFRTGDRVVLDQGLNCVSHRHAERCEYCDTGHSHHCEFFREYGITGIPGGLAEYLAIPDVNVLKIDSDIEPAFAAMTEPLGCVIHALDTTGMATTRYSIDAADQRERVRNILLTGAGPAGLLFIQVLRNMLGYQGRIIVSDPTPLKRERAAALGADVVDPLDEDLIERVEDMTDGRRVELMIEASGSGPLFRQIPGLIRKQATILLYGFGHGGIGMEALNPIHFIEPVIVTPTGASGPLDAEGKPLLYEQSLRAIESGTIRVDGIVTHQYDGLEQIPAAFAGDHLGETYIKGIAVF